MLCFEKEMKWNDEKWKYKNYNKYKYRNNFIVLEWKENNNNQFQIIDFKSV